MYVFCFHLALILTSPVDRRTIRRIGLCIGPSWFVWIRHWRQRCRQIAGLVYSMLAFCWFFYWRKTGREEKVIQLWNLVCNMEHDNIRPIGKKLIDTFEALFPKQKYSFSRMFRVLCLFWRSNTNGATLHREPRDQQEKKEKKKKKLHAQKFTRRKCVRKCANIAVHSDCTSLAIKNGHANDSSC